MNYTIGWSTFNRDLKKAFSKTCKEGEDKFAYAINDFTNIKISVLQDHSKIVEH